MGWPVLCLALIMTWMLHAYASSSTTYVLRRRSELSVEKRDVDFLVSSDRTFSCGFFQVGNNAFTFSIWFNPSNDTRSGPSTPTSRADVVWSANRDLPLNGHGSKVSLQGSNLVLVDGYDGSTVWTTAAITSRTNGQAPSNSESPAEEAVLLDSGNLVLRDAGGKILWQSFDFPTDTLLPGQPFTKTTRLISSDSKSSLSTASHILYFDNDNVLRLMYDGSEIASIYWPDPDKTVWVNGRTIYNSSRFAVFDRAGRFISSDGFGFDASDHDLPINAVNRRLTLDFDGNLRFYSRIKDNRYSRKQRNQWYVTWQAMLNECKIHGQCGMNGICTFGLERRCSCPPGYRRANPSSWRDGCKPIFPTASIGNNYFCPDNGNSSYEFVKVEHADFYGSDISFRTSVSFETCRRICEQDCNCQAFVYSITGQGSCYPKSFLFNGYTTPRLINSLFVKLPRNFSILHPNITFSAYPNLEASTSRLHCIANATITLNRYKEASSSKNIFKWAYGYSFVAGIGLLELLFIAIGWWFLYGRDAPNDSAVYSLGVLDDDGGYHYKYAISNPFRIFSYDEVKRATNNFKNILGKGASGEVYKGVLGDKRVVAVKRLLNVENGTQGDEEFRAELNLIGRINHMNLVRMWGFCVQSSQRILIYEYIGHGTLANALFIPHQGGNDNCNNTTNLVNHSTCTITSSLNLVHRENVLNWSRRFDIALGIARGLAYLHHECLDWIIHCDIKPENILLDVDHQPKIADFGLAKLTRRDNPNSHLTKVRGTKGYMAPDWTSNAPITTKVDVYSYGVVLLELLRGDRLCSWEAITNKLLPSYYEMMGNQVEFSESTQILRQCLAKTMKEQLEETKDPSSLANIIKDFMDPRLHGDFNLQEAHVLLDIALLCIEGDRNKRPTMDYVVQKLLDCSETKFGVIN